MKNVLLSGLLCCLGFVSTKGWAQNLEPSPKPASTKAKTAPVIKDIQFVGNRRTEEEAIRMVLAKESGIARQTSTIGQPMDAQLIQEDILRLWRAGAFDDIQVRQEPVEGGVRLWFVVKEKPVINKISVKGNTEVKSEDIKTALTLRDRALVTPEKIRENEQKIKDLYLQEGFPFVEVESKLLSAGEGIVDVEFHVREQAKVTIRSVQFSFAGKKHFPESELRKVMYLRPGTPLERFKTLASYLNVSATRSPIWPGTFRKDVLEADLQANLIGFYQNHGYWNAQIGKPTILLSDDKEWVDITIPVEEGSQFHVSKVQIRYEDEDPKQDPPLSLRRKVLETMLKVKPGKVASLAEMKVDQATLTSHYEELGYAKANVTPAQEEDKTGPTNSLLITYTIKPGILFRVGRIHINISGPGVTKDSVARLEMAIAEGDLYQKSLIEKSKEQLLRRAYFERVEIKSQINPEDPNKLDLFVEVTERKAGQIQGAVGWSSLESFLATGNVSQLNLGGYGVDVDLRFQFAVTRINGSFTYKDTRFLDTPVLFGFTASAQRTILSYFSQENYGGSVTGGYVFDRSLTLSATYNLGWRRALPNTDSTSFVGTFGYFSIDPSVYSYLNQNTLPSLYRRGWVSSVVGMIDYDTRSSEGSYDSFSPGKGMWHNLSFEVPLGSQLKFFRGNATFRFYVPLYRFNSKKNAIMFRAQARGGYVWSPDPEGVPLYERYYLGGPQGVRGFAFGGLGPQIPISKGSLPGDGVTNLPIGGNLMLMGNVELEVPVVPQIGLRLAGFFDAGNVYNTEAQYCTPLNVPGGTGPLISPCTQTPTFQNLRYSAGAELRLPLPVVGLLRLGIGVPLFNRQASIYGRPGESAYMIYFGIGPSF